MFCGMMKENSKHVEIQLKNRKIREAGTKVSMNS
jgi:hypothetical protein